MMITLKADVDMVYYNHKSMTLHNHIHMHKLAIQQTFRITYCDENRLIEEKKMRKFCVVRNTLGVICVLVY